MFSCLFVCLGFFFSVCLFFVFVYWFIIQLLVHCTLFLVMPAWFHHCFKFSFQFCCRIIPVLMMWQVFRNNTDITHLMLFGVLFGLQFDLLFSLVDPQKSENDPQKFQSKGHNDPQKFRSSGNTDKA